MKYRLGGSHLSLTRPYSRTNLVQGTCGILRGFPEFQVSLENHDLKKGQHFSYRWRSAKEYFEQSDHTLWSDLLARAAKVETVSEDFKLSDEIRSGDYLEDYRRIDVLLDGRTPDYDDDYDAASWSAVTGLSEESVANKSKAVDLPDVTKVKWKTRKPLEVAGL